MTTTKHLISWKRSALFLGVFFLFASCAIGQTTSWTGTTSTNWNTSGNWTNGEPDEDTDAIIGDASFTGSFQPILTSGTAKCKSLTVGNGSITSILTIDRNITVYGSILIGANGTILHPDNKDITLQGDWTNSGTYVASHNGAGVNFSGSAVTLSGTTSFRDLRINSGCYVTLAGNISISSDADVYGTLDPTASYVVSGTADLDVERDGRIVVHTATFAGNYTISQVDLNDRCYVEYASASITQTISSAYNYGYLVISGGSTKELAANLPTIHGSNANEGRVFIEAGILDLKTFTADRQGGSGGDFVISADAELWIGGTNSFPSNFNVLSFATSSTVKYYGNNQTILDADYGHLILSGTTGNVVKTLPATTLDVYGSLTIEEGNATSLTCTAASNINVFQEVSIDAGATFNASSYTHSFNSDFQNEGTFNGNSSTVQFTGVAAELSGGGTTNFNNVIFTQAGIYAASGTDLSASGDVEIQGGGTFTHQPTGMFTMSGTSKEILGSGFVFYDLEITGSVSTAVDVRVAGDFLVDGSFSATNNAIIMTGSSGLIDGIGTITFHELEIEGTITTDKDFTINSAFAVSNLASFVASAGTITANGTTNFSGTATLYDLAVNSTKSFIMGSNAYLKISNTISNSGTFNSSSFIPNTVEYTKNGAQAIGGVEYYNLILATGGTKTLSGNCTVNNDITINSGVTLDGSSFDLMVYRHWNNNGTFTASTSDVQFRGSNASILTGATTFNDFTVNKTSSSVQVSLENNMIASNIIMTQGWVETGSNSISTTSGRTGNGIIIGTIIHDHAIVDGVTYYFEGPSNGLTFYGPTSLNEVGVTITLGEVTNVDPTVESVTREYDINIPSGTYDSATIQLHYEDNELNAFVEPFLSIYKYNTGTTWDSLGYYGRDIADNYVYIGGITNADGNYMLSGLRNIVRWVGGVSSAWENAANWTTISGASMANRVPDSLDVAQIGEATFTNQPEITTTEKINVLRFGSAKAATLSINGGSLQIVGSARGNWSTNRSHTIDVGDDSLIIGTNLTLSDGVNAHDIDLIINTGVVNIGYDLVQTATGSVTFTSSGLLEIEHSYEYTAGTFTPSTGTVSYEGGVNQVIAALSYYNLAIDKTTARARILTPTTVSNNLSTMTGGELAVLDSLYVLNDITIGSSTELLEFNSVISVGGDWSNSGLFSVTGGKVIFNGTAAQTVDANTFNNLEVNKSAGVLSLTASININNELAISSGILDLETYQANRTTEGGQLSIDSNATLRIAGANNFPTNFQTVSIDTHSTVEYDGVVVQEVLPVSYGNLVFSNGAPNDKTISGNSTVLGDLTINATAEVNPDTTTITLYGNFTNSGTVDPAQSTLLLEGSNKTITGSTTLNNVSVINGSYTVVSGTTEIAGNLFVGNSGSLSFGSNTAILDGDLTNSGTLTSTGTATFTGTRVQNISLLNAISSSSTGIINFNGTVAPVISSSSSPVFATVNINNTAGITPSVPWTVLVAMNIGAGASFNGAALTHTFYGDFTNSGTVSNTGKLLFSPGAPYSASATITLDGTSFSNSGEVELAGNVPISLVTTAPTFGKLVISNTHSSGITADNDWFIGGVLQVDAGSEFNAGTGTSHTLMSNLEVNGVFDGETSMITFDGDTCAIAGSGEINFQDVTIGDTSVVNLNHDIKVYSDFVNDGEFIADGRLVTFIGSTAGTISGSTGYVTFDELETAKNGGATTTLSIPVTVTGNLTLTSATFTTDATNLIIIADDATADTGKVNSFVRGPMKKVGDDAFVFPLGVGTKWARLGISAPSSTTDEFTAQHFGAAYSNTSSMASSPTPVLTSVSTVEYWTLDRTAGTSNVTVELYWEDATLSGITTVSTDLVVARFNGTAWENAGHTAIQGGTRGSVTSSTVTSFSPFTFGALTTNPLPVELLEFDAWMDENSHVQLKWKTASELNNDFFTVERSVDGINFEEVTEVDGAGTSQEVLEYSNTDYAPYSGTSYYRIKQTDFNGEYSYSDIKVVENNRAVEIGVYPNPVHASLNIDLPKDKVSSLRILDVSGKEVMYIKNTTGNRKIDFSDFKEGLYILQVSIDGEIRNFKLVHTN